MINRYENRIAVYTAIFGDYDKVLDPRVWPRNIDYYMISDKYYPSRVWRQKDISKFINIIKDFSPQMKNRFFKMHPHLLFPDYKYTIYVDGNRVIKGDFNGYIPLIGEYGLATYHHNRRDCTFDECTAVVDQGKDSMESVLRHIEFLEAEGMPRHYGLPFCHVLARRKCQMADRIMKMWWEEYTRYSRRDQISFPHVLYELGIPVSKVATLGKPVGGDRFIYEQVHKHMKADKLK
ncbi:hypothetical protein AGMMS49992_21650 [Clostridia bacterium]|nr:hypothetical protein AGMMS49992_21650 [Clostridia bacterium]